MRGGLLQGTSLWDELYANSTEEFNVRPVSAIRPDSVTDN